MSEITSPIMLDDTGQDLVTEAQNIVTKLQALINAVKPTAADIPLAAISGMTADDVQEGVEELNSNLTDLSDRLAWKRIDSDTITNLSTFCAYIDNLIGSTSGYRTGYIAANVAQRIGLSNEGYYYDVKANSNNYRIVIVNNASGSLYKTLVKAAGTWQATWKGVTLS